MRSAFTSSRPFMLVSWLAAGCASAPTSPGEPAAPSVCQNATTGVITSLSTGGLPASPSFRLFNKTVIYVKDTYFDPARIHPQQMLVAALQSVARVAPQLRLETVGPDTLGLASGDELCTFDLAHVDSLWTMSFRFSEIYKSLTGPLGIADPSAKIGFAATNGMLSTLDPRSVLLTQKWYEEATKSGANPSAVGLTAHLLSSGIGYIRLRDLTRLASSEVGQAITDLSQTTETRGQLRGVVLDLRASPGGLFEEAVRVTNLFVDDGVVVKTVGLSGRNRQDHRATKNAKVTGAPVVVVVDELTASGAEIIAAALKDLDRAVVVGQRTNGAGTVQVLYELADPDGISKAYLKLTIAAILRSSGTPIDLGVVPDIELRPTGPLSQPDAGTPPGKAAQSPFAPGSATRPRTSERSLATLSYSPASLAPADGGFVEDFPIRFAHDLLLHAQFARRSDMLPQAKALAADRR